MSITIRNETKKDPEPSAELYLVGADDHITLRGVDKHGKDYAILSVDPQGVYLNVSVGLKALPTDRSGRIKVKNHPEDITFTEDVKPSSKTDELTIYLPQMDEDERQPQMKLYLEKEGNEVILRGKDAYGIKWDILAIDSDGMAHFYGSIHERSGWLLDYRGEIQLGSSR